MILLATDIKQNLTTHITAHCQANYKNKNISTYSTGSSFIPKTFLESALVNLCAPAARVSV